MILHRPIDVVRALHAAEPLAVDADILHLSGLHTDVPRGFVGRVKLDASYASRSFVLPAPVADWARAVTGRFACPMTAIEIRPRVESKGGGRPEVDFAGFWSALRTAERRFLIRAAGVLSEGSETLACLTLRRHPGWSVDYTLWRREPAAVEPEVERSAYPLPGLDSWMSGISTLEISGEIDASAHARAALARGAAVLDLKGEAG